MVVDKRAHRRRKGCKYKERMGAFPEETAGSERAQAEVRFRLLVPRQDWGNGILRWSKKTLHLFIKGCWSLDRKMAPTMWLVPW